MTDITAPPFTLPASTRTAFAPAVDAAPVAVVGDVEVTSDQLASLIENLISAVTGLTVSVSFPTTTSVTGSVAISNTPHVVVDNPSPATDVSALATNATLLAKGRQSVDSGNTATRTSTNGATQFVGTWTSTRSAGVVRLLTVLASTVSSGLGGTFVFEFSEDAATALISESRIISDFSTVRDFDLINAGAYYRVKFTPDRALTGAEKVFITTTLRTQNDGAFVRLAGQQIEEANAAMGQTFAFLKAFDERTGKSRNIRPSPTGAIYTSEERTFVTESGSLDTESVRDDISLSFSRDNYAVGVTKLVDHSTAGATASQDATSGRIKFATSATSGKTAYFESADIAVYEPGHMIRGEQTIYVTPALAGTAKVEWGFGEDDGTGGILNGVGWGLDVTGLYVWRIVAGSYASKVYQSSFNYDKLDGTASSRFRKISGVVAFDSTKNTLYAVNYEWLGIAPPAYRIQNPTGQFVTAHIEETSNQISGTTLPEPGLSLFVRVTNGNQATDYNVYSGSWRGGIYTSKSLLDPAKIGRTGQQDVTTIPAVLALSGSPRRAVRLKNMTTSARALFYGFTSGVATTDGDELAPGEAVDLDLDETRSVYVVCASTGGGGVRASWIELGA